MSSHDKPRHDTQLELRAHDLPPSWEGQEVEWSAWTEEPWTTLRLHVDDQGACPECGSLALRRHARGLVAGVVALHVSRCSDCRHDTVLEFDTGEVWDLDMTDYGDGGSTHDPGASRAAAVARARAAIRPTRPPVTAAENSPFSAAIALSERPRTLVSDP